MAQTAFLNSQRLVLLRRSLSTSALMRESTLKIKTVINSIMLPVMLHDVSCHPF